jgi:hypothetical protein
MIFLSFTYLGYFVCHQSCSQLRTLLHALSFILKINLNKDIRDGEFGDGGMGGGGCEETIPCLSLNQETFRSTVPPAVALLNYMRNGTLWQSFSKIWDFFGFSSICH